MNVSAILDDLYKRGVQLRIDGERLRWFAPVGVVTEIDLTALREHKAEVLATLAAPDPDAFEERAAIIEHDGGMPRQDAETLAAQEQGFDDADSLHRESVGRWAAEIERLAKLPAISPDGAAALERAQAFITEGWALQAARLGWVEVDLFGVSSRAPWRRLDRKGVAFGGAIQAITQDAVVYVGGLRRYRAQVNNDGGAIPIWELAQDNPSNGGEAA